MDERNDASSHTCILPTSLAIDHLNDRTILGFAADQQPSQSTTGGSMRSSLIPQSGRILTLPALLLFVALLLACVGAAGVCGFGSSSGV